MNKLKGGAYLDLISKRNPQIQLDLATTDFPFSPDVTFLSSGRYLSLWIFLNYGLSQ